MQIKALGAAGAGGESMYIPDFLCGFIVGAICGIGIIIAIAYVFNAKNKKR